MQPFDPVGEVRRLRRRLALHIQACEQPERDSLPVCQPEIEAQTIALPLPAEPFSLEIIVEQVGEMRKTLATWQRFRQPKKTPPTPIFRGDRQSRRQKRLHPVEPQYLVETQYLTAPREGTLETINAGLTALGIVGIVFGILSFSHGWTSGLSMGLQVSLSGLAVIVVGLGGRFLSSQVDPSVL